MITVEQIPAQVAYFECCYHSFLGLLAGVTSFDDQEAVDKVVRMNNTIDPDQALGYVLQVGLDVDNMDEIPHLLRHIAAHNALQDYLDWDEELTNKDHFESTIVQSIGDGSAFNDNYYALVKSSLPERTDAWKELFDAALIEEIRELFVQQSFSSEEMTR